MDTLKRALASKLLKIKAIKLQPDNPFTWASGWKSPFYCDNRKTLSFPDLRSFVKLELAHAVLEHFPEATAVAGVATGAIAQGALVADELGLPFAYVRSKAKDHGMGNLIEGEIPEGAKNSKGRAIQNLLNIEPDDSIKAFLRLRGSLDDQEFINSHYVVFATKNGLIKKTSLEAYSRPRANGVMAINVLDGDEVVGVRLTNGHNELLLADRNGHAVRFNESTVRAMGRVSTGVRGMRLDGDDDEVIGMVVVNKPEIETIMVVSENGYGKRSQVEDYRMTNRGGKGVKTLSITEKTGRLVAIKVVTDDNDLMIINKSGILIRLKVSDCRVMGRATQGVRLINLTKKNDVISSVCKVMSSDLEALAEAESRKEWNATSEAIRNDGLAVESDADTLLGDVAEDADGDGQNDE